MIATDKQLHFLGGIVLCLAVSLFFGGIVGLAIAVVVGVAKELWDAHGHGTPDVWDAVATVAGGVTGFVLIMISEAL